jgi:hypothetical protein
MLHKALGDDLRHDRLGVADVLSLAVTKRKRECVLDLGGRRGREIVAQSCPRICSE